MLINEKHPKLRAVEVHPFEYQGRPFLLLRDPMGLCDQSVLVAQELAPALALCDGTRNLEGIVAALALRYRIQVPQQTLRELVDTLDQALLLESERYLDARREALRDYHQAPFRSPALAGESYPGEAGDLRELLQAYVEASAGSEIAFHGGRGLVSPHIDYHRGGMVYAATWQHAAEMIREAELAIVFGTDHHGCGNDITLTRQSYATPFGVLPTPPDALAAVAAAVGEEKAFEGELSHQGEHSIELAAVWLHFIRGGEACNVLPILCGGLSRFLDEEADPDADPEQDVVLTRLVDSLRAVAAGRKTVVIAAADLAHVGPAFGGEPLDDNTRAAVQMHDEELVGHICAGDAGGFLGALREVRNATNVCGAGPIYLALRTLGESRGECLAYASCPADAENTSAVTVAGVVLE